MPEREQELGHRIHRRMPYKQTNRLGRARACLRTLLSDVLPSHDMYPAAPLLLPHQYGVFRSVSLSKIGKNTHTKTTLSEAQNPGYFFKLGGSLTKASRPAPYI